MKIIEARFRAVDDDYLRAHLDLVIEDDVFGSFALHDLRIIQLFGGDLIVQMPYRKADVRCGNCDTKVNFDAQYCSCCAYLLPRAPIARRGRNGREVTHYDVFHPIDSETRQRWTDTLLGMYREWIANDNPAALPGRVGSPQQGGENRDG